jgi:hypothetical protein
LGQGGSLDFDMQVFLAVGPADVEREASALMDGVVELGDRL